MKYIEAEYSREVWLGRKKLAVNLKTKWWSNYAGFCVYLIYDVEDLVWILLIHFPSIPFSDIPSFPFPPPFILNFE